MDAHCKSRMRIGFTHHLVAHLVSSMPMLSYLCFRFAHISWSEQELSIQIAVFDCVHIDYVNVAKTHHGQIFEKFAA